MEVDLEKVKIMRITSRVLKPPKMTRTPKRPRPRVRARMIKPKSGNTIPTLISGIQRPSKRASQNTQRPIPAA